MFKFPQVKRLIRKSSHVSRDLRGFVGSFVHGTLDVARLQVLGDEVTLIAISATCCVDDVGNLYGWTLKRTAMMECHATMLTERQYENRFALSLIHI